MKSDISGQRYIGSQFGNDSVLEVWFLPVLVFVIGCRVDDVPPREVRQSFGKNEVPNLEFGNQNVRCFPRDEALPHHWR